MYLIVDLEDEVHSLWDLWKTAFKNPRSFFFWNRVEHTTIFGHDQKNSPKNSTRLPRSVRLWAPPLDTPPPESPRDNSLGWCGAHAVWHELEAPTNAQDWSLQCPSNAIMALQIIPLSKRNPTLKMKTSLEGFNIIWPPQQPTSLGHCHYKK